MYRARHQWTNMQLPHALLDQNDKKRVQKEDKNLGVFKAPWEAEHVEQIHKPYKKTCNLKGDLQIEERLTYGMETCILQGDFHKMVCLRFWDIYEHADRVGAEAVAIAACKQ